MSVQPDSVSNEAPSRVYIIAFHKAGSSMVEQTVHHLELLGNNTHCCSNAHWSNDDPSSFGHKSQDAECQSLVYFSRAMENVSPAFDFSNSSIQKELREAKSCEVILQIRHPFDIAVSAFQSFTTLNHYIAHDKGTPEYEKVVRNRAAMHAKGIDEYAIEKVSGVDRQFQVHFQNLIFAEDQGCSVWISRYEDMISFPRSFLTRLSDSLQVERSETWKRKIEELVAKQQRLLPDEHSHTAYIYPGQHRLSLQNSTIVRLTHLLSIFTLQRSGYF